MFLSDIPTSNEILLSTFADHVKASTHLERHIRNIETWLANWRIKVNETESKHVTFKLKRNTCPRIKFKNINIPQSNEVTYLGIHLDRRLTWRKYIAAKRTQLKLIYQLTLASESQIYILQYNLNIKFCCSEVL